MVVKNADKFIAPVHNFGAERDLEWVWAKPVKLNSADNLPGVRGLVAVEYRDGHYIVHDKLFGVFGSTPAARVAGQSFYAGVILEYPSGAPFVRVQVGGEVDRAVKFPTNTVAETGARDVLVYDGSTPFFNRAARTALSVAGELAMAVQVSGTAADATERKVYLLGWEIQ